MNYKQEQIYLAAMSADRNFKEATKFIDDLNIAIEFCVYFNGLEEKHEAEKIMRGVLKCYNASMDLLPHQHKYVRELIREYCE